MNGDTDRMWMEAGVVSFKVQFCNFLEDWGKLQRHQESRSPSRDSNTVLPEYETVIISHYTVTSGEFPSAITLWRPGSSLLRKISLLQGRMKRLEQEKSTSTQRLWENWLKSGSEKLCVTGTCGSIRFHRTAPRLHYIVSMVTDVVSFKLVSVLGWNKTLELRKDFNVANYQLLYCYGCAQNYRKSDPLGTEVAHGAIIIHLSVLYLTVNAVFVSVWFLTHL